MSRQTKTEEIKRIFTPDAYKVLKVADYSNSTHLVDTSAQDAKDYAKDKKGV